MANGKPQWIVKMTIDSGPIPVESKGRAQVYMRRSGCHWMCLCVWIIFT